MSPSRGGDKPTLREKGGGGTGFSNGSGLQAGLELNGQPWWHLAPGVGWDGDPSASTPLLGVTGTPWWDLGHLGRLGTLNSGGTHGWDGTTSAGWGHLSGMGVTLEGQGHPGWDGGFSC